MWWLLLLLLFSAGCIGDQSAPMEDHSPVVVGEDHSAGEEVSPNTTETGEEESGENNAEGGELEGGTVVNFNEIDAQLLQELVAGHKGLHCTYTAEESGVRVHYTYDYQPMGDASYFRMVVEPEGAERMEVMGYTKSLGNGQGEQGTYIKLNPQLKMIYQQRLGKDCDWVFARQTFEVEEGEWNEPALHNVEISNIDTSLPDDMTFEGRCEVVPAFDLSYFTPQGGACGYEELAASYGGS